MENSRLNTLIDLRKSTAFYYSIFEFETIEEVAVGERQFAFLGYDGGTVLTRLHHSAFQGDDVATVLGVEAVVRALGAHDGATAC